MIDKQDLLNQLEKKVQWLDDERRKDKSDLASLLNQIKSLISENSSLRESIKETDERISELTLKLSSFDKYDTRIERAQTDLTKKIKESEEKSDSVSAEQSKRFKFELENVNKVVTNLVPLSSSITDVQTELKSHQVEFTRLTRAIEEVKDKVTSVGRFDEDYKRSLRLIEETTRQDAKRISDLQGEVIAQRKRLEENRSRMDLIGDNFRPLENRINELQNLDKERREAQSAFFDRINLQVIERDKVFKEWNERFIKIENINTDLDSQMATLENTNKLVNKSVTALDDVTQRFDRRINEISEINRLNDERFRQEWTSFKVDDQKRWTNYVLGQEEQHREINRELEKYQPQIYELETAIQVVQDSLEQISQESVKRFQSILRTYQESILTHNELGKQHP
jgi:chromosome segregation ATPase